VFLPLAIFSLTRLLPAMWLSDEFTYGVMEPTSMETAFEAMDMTPRQDEQQISNAPYLQDDRFLINNVHQSKGNKLRPQTYWPAILFRITIVLVLVAFVGIGVGHLLTNKEFSGDLNVSGVSEHFLYSIWVVITLIIFVVFGVRGKANTTIIPCIGSRWYLAYTLLWYIGAVAVIVLNAVQMRQTSCGVYTTYAASDGLDNKLCAMYNA